VTTIVYRDGIMASDSRAYSGDKHPMGNKVKIRRLKDGTLMGVSTTTPGGGEAVLDWIENDRPADTTVPEHFTLLIAHPDGRVFYATDADFLSGPLEGEFFVIGSGEQYAHGACLMGATAVEAVRAGCIADTFTDFPIYAASHKRKTIWKVDK
jgi:ATP-dependent protease HslVU (ClpYQ) peptidase subunit